MTSNRAWLVLAACLVSPLTTAYANVVTDWDEKAVGVVQTKMAPPASYRVICYEQQTSRWIQASRTGPTVVPGPCTR